LLLAAGPVRAQWSSPQVLSSPTDWNNGANAMKDMKMQPASGGGFHCVWCIPGTHQVRYRRMFGDGTLGPVMAAANAGSSLTFNADVCELGNGTVQVVYEHWNPSGGPEVGFTQLTPGSNTFTSIAVVSNSGQDAKFPQVAGFGTGASKKSVVSYWDSGDKNLRSIRNNGAGFTGDNYLGQKADNEYVVTGIATSPLDGSVWRSWGTKIATDTYRINICRLDPDTQLWESKIEVPTSKTAFFSRISVDVNDSGHVMVAYDSGNSTTGRIYSPESNTWGSEMPLFSKSFFGNVAAVPGTNNFYVFNAYSNDFPMVRPVLNETFDGNLSEYPGPVDQVFIPSIRGAVDVNGKAYVAWENWDERAGQPGNPQIMYSVRSSVFGLTAIPEPATAGVALTLLAAVATARRRCN
jgi:hypothetical protein